MQDTSSINKRIAKNTVFLYLRTMLTMIVSLYTSRVILQILGVEDYGIYNVVGGFVTLMSFLSGAISSSTSRYITFALGKGDEKYLKDVFSTSLLAHLVIACIIVFIGETLGLWFVLNKLIIPEERMTAALVAYQIGLLSTVIYMWSIPYNACIIAHEKMSAFAYISIYEAVTKLLIVFLLVYIPIDKLISYSILLFAVQLSVRLIYSWYCRKYFVESQTRFLWNKNLFKEILSFSGWNVFGNLGFILHTEGMAVVLNMFFSVTVNAAQGIVNQVNSAVNVFVGNFLTALNPQVVKTYAASEFQQMHSLIVRGSKTAICMVAFFVIPLFLEAPIILKVWLSIVPDYTVLFLRLILVISLVNSFSSILANAKAATGDIKTYQVVLTIIGVFHIPFAWIAFKLGGGPEYSMYIYLFLVIIMQIVRISCVCQSINMNILWFIKEVIIRCSIAIFISSIIPTLFHMLLHHTLFDSVVVIVLSLISVFLSSVFIALSTTERKSLMYLIKNKFNHSNK